MVRRLEEELDSANGESRHLSAELARTTARLERLQERIQGHALTNSHLVSRNADLLSRNSVLRQQQLDMTATDKDHASTQTDPLPSVITSPSLVTGRQSPAPDDDAPDMPPDSPSDGGKSAFRRQLKYKRKLGAVI